MSKDFMLHDGSFPSPAYVDDPAGGRAMRFTNSHKILAAHTDFGNVDLFPGGDVGDVTMTMTLRMKLDVSVAAGTHRDILTFAPARWTGSAWEFPISHNGTSIRWRMSSANQLEVTTRNLRGGEPGSGARIRRLSTAQTADACNNTFKEFRWQARYRMAAEGGVDNLQDFWVDGEHMGDDAGSWISKPLDFSSSEDPIIGSIELSGANFRGEISTFRLELKDNT